MIDRQLKGIINEKLDQKDIMKVPKAERDIIIKDIYNLTSVSIRQLSRVTEINRSIIERAIRT